MQNRNNHRITRFGLLLGGLTACFAILLAGCHRTPAEELIRGTIATMQKAGEKQDVDGVLEPLAEDFTGRGDDEINLDRKQLKQFLTVLRMEQKGGIHATLGQVTVALDGSDRATADFSMQVTGGKGLIPNDGQSEQVHTGWRLDGSRWKLILAEWKSSAAK